MYRRIVQFFKQGIPVIECCFFNESFNCIFNESFNEKEYPYDLNIRNRSGVVVFLAHLSRRLVIFNDQNLSGVRRRYRCPWVKGIQVYSNEGLCPFPRGDNYEIAEIH